MIVQWQLNPDFQLCWKEWGNQFVLYHTGSGDTHLFDQFGYDILQLLKIKPITTAELREQLMADINWAISREYDTAETSLNEFLNNLHRLGITEQVDL